jgi:hypothetical protein
MILTFGISWQSVGIFLGTDKSIINKSLSLLLVISFNSFFEIKASLDDVEKIATSTFNSSFLKDSNFIALIFNDFAKSLDFLNVLFAILILV